MLSLTGRYFPITGDPGRMDDTYWELPPCEALRPYVRCFWGTPRPVTPKPDSIRPDQPGLVIPDTCMDIIFDINYTRNRCGSAFCTLDEQSYRTDGGGLITDTTATFAIRFYGWTASLFADWDFTGSKNAHFDPREMFAPLVRALEPYLFDEPTLEGKARIAEAFLLHRLDDLRPENDLLNAVHYLLATSGREPVSELCGYAGVSPRKLERLFQRHMGLSPKSFASLARYQMLWQELAGRPQLSLLDAVAKYGYTDQAHLLHDFKRRHLMTPSEALRYAGILIQNAPLTR